jgi:outer membrane lipoprotein carrier protein
MKKILAFLMMMALVTVTFAQNNQYTKSNQSDPAAKKLLDKVKAKYESYKTMQADFTLTIEIPEEAAEVQKGKFMQSGEKYRLEAEAQTMVSDGETLWLHMKNSEEVQINDVEEDEGDILSPSSFLSFYESEEFVYFLVNEFPEDGVVVQQIEFKPLDEDSEYHKVRLTLNKKTNDVMRIKAFSKDGSRFTFELGKLIANPAIPEATFKMVKSECSECHWEDMRI